MKLNFPLITIALITTHQVDASYQKEWTLFGIPGGIDFFLFFNFAAMLMLTWGLLQNTKIWNRVIAGMGFLTVSIHCGFISYGHKEFTQISSLIILGLILFSSIGQLLWESRARKC